MTKKLTERQKHIYDFINIYIKENGYSPTFREIADANNIKSVNGVNDHLKALEKKGYIKKISSKSRTILPIHNTQIHSNKKKNVELVKSEETTKQIPLLGQVAAGEPILAQENVEEVFELNTSVLGSIKQNFALRVNGQSMINAGIMDGDFIFVRQQQTANRGDIIVALIDNEATVKRFYPGKGRIVLKPENSEMEPLVYNEKDFKQVRIVGIVTAIFRRLL